jgi:hypothetical protein
MARKFGRFWNASRLPYASPAIESLYPSAITRYTMSDLEDFVDISAMSRMKNEGDVMLYYRRFLQMSTPLYNSKELTDDQRNHRVLRRLPH